MKAHIVLLPGDGIGPEVVAEGVKVLKAVAQERGMELHLQEELLGACAIDRTGSPLPPATLEAVSQCDAVLMGAVGHPKYDDPKLPVRPEQGLLGLRKAMGVFANLRPVAVMPALLHASTLKPEVLQGTDLIVVRELTGGIYFGQPKERGVKDGQRWAMDTMHYWEHEVRRVAHVAFRLARQRRKKLTSVDKANVLECSRMWREVVNEVAQEYPDVTLEHMLVDACAMALIRTPTSFDVVLTENMFGDILTDEAAMLAGSIGMLPSASLGEGRRGLYEPIHGSAPTIAGKNIANPLGTILSVAMLLRHSLDMETEARAVEEAVAAVLAAGYRTADIAEPGCTTVGTSQMGDLVVQHLKL
ncbi:MAG: 3-isopropylmalate dehydrogenase [Anaerolineae bacterium]|nr:3-isopropylmalate dehydrogenase [Anaerolineae bacterium]